MFTTIWVSGEAVSLLLVFHPPYRHKQLSLYLLYCGDGLSGHFCDILMVFLFYLAGFPRKQTGKNLYFLIFKDISALMGR